MVTTETGVKKYVVRLSEDERQRLEEMVRKGKSSAGLLTRARVLLKADVSEGGPGWSDNRIMEALEVSASLVYDVRQQLVKEGLDAVLTRKKRLRPPVEPIFDGEKEAKLIALGCSSPPAGYARWTLRLLEKKVVELQIVDAASDSTIGRVLKKTSCNLTARNSGSFHRKPTVSSWPRWKMFLRFIADPTIPIAQSSVLTRRRNNLSRKNGRPFLLNLDAPSGMITNMNAMAPPICSCCSRRSKGGGTLK